MQLSIAKTSMLAAMLICAAAAQAHAGILINVDSTDDAIDDNLADGVCHSAADTCTLRAAVMQANHNRGPSIINVPAGTYLLTLAPTAANDASSGDLNLSAPLDSYHSFQKLLILGAGADSTIIDGNQTDRIFAVAQGRVVDIDGITVRNGRAANGGGIYNFGRLTLSACVIEDSFAGGDGGGIASSSISGVDNDLHVVGSTIRSNTALGSHGIGGGGIYANGKVTIRDSTISGNTAENGGGIANSFILYISNSTISGNHAKSNGGGITHDYSATQTALYSSSVIGNDANHDNQGWGKGGGIHAGTGQTVVNTLIAGNTRQNFSVADDCDSHLAVYGKNFLGSAMGCTFGGNGGVAWALIALSSIGPLQDNGGPTLTHALLPGSLAINAGGYGNQVCIDEIGRPLATDQLGAPRAAGGRCDVGAYELQ